MQELHFQDSCLCIDTGKRRLRRERSAERRARYSSRHADTSVLIRPECAYIIEQRGVPIIGEHYDGFTSEVDMATWVIYQQEQLPQIFFEKARVDVVLRDLGLLSEADFVDRVRKQIFENGNGGLAPLESRPLNTADYTMGLKILHHLDGGTTHLYLREAFCSLVVSALIFYVGDVKNQGKAAVEAAVVAAVASAAALSQRLSQSESNVFAAALRVVKSKRDRGDCLGADSVTEGEVANELEMSSSFEQNQIGLEMESIAAKGLLRKAVVGSNGPIYVITGEW